MSSNQVVGGGGDGAEGAPAAYAAAIVSGGWVLLASTSRTEATSRWARAQAFAMRSRTVASRSAISFVAVFIARSFDCGACPCRTFTATHRSHGEAGDGV